MPHACIHLKYVIQAASRVPTFTLHLHSPSPLESVISAAENRGQIWGGDHGTHKMCVPVHLGNIGEKVAWGVLTNWFFLFLPTITNYHESKQVKMKNSGTNTEKEREEGHTHTSSTSQRSHYQYNWTERRDYVQIKLRMHTNRDYSIMSLLASTSNTTKGLNFQLFTCHVIHWVT